MNAGDALRAEGLGPFHHQDLRVISGSKTIARCDSPTVASAIAEALSWAFEEGSLDDQDERVEDEVLEVRSDYEDLQTELKQAVEKNEEA